MPGIGIHGPIRTTSAEIPIQIAARPAERASEPLPGAVSVRASSVDSMLSALQEPRIRRVLREARAPGDVDPQPGPRVPARQAQLAQPFQRPAPLGLVV